MNIKEIEEALTYFNENYPLEAMEAAIKRRDEITPLLLDALDDAYIRADDLDPNYMLHIFGMYLLAQFREKKAFPKLIKVLELNEKQLDIVLGDSLTEDYSTILFSTFDGDVQALRKVIEDNTLYVFARDAALRAYSSLFTSKDVSREVYMDDLRRWLNVEEDDELVTWVTLQISDLKLHELIPDVTRAYKEFRVDETVNSYSGFIDWIFKKRRPKKLYIEDAIKETQSWACFKKEEFTKDRKDMDVSSINKNLKKINPKVSEKIGRNEPCPCGSGKKYKKCCLNNRRELANELSSYERAILVRYPSHEQLDGQVGFYDYFSEDAIEIDRLVYLGTQHPFGIYPNMHNELRLKNLLKAYELWINKMESEKLSSFSEYDALHQVHFFSFDWIKRLSELIEDYQAHDRVKVMPVAEALQKYDDDGKNDDYNFKHLISIE